MGKYREIALIGQGGMAKVTLAALEGPVGFQKLLVIKEILPLYATDPEFVAMFMDEARLAARLEHQNLVQTYEVHEGDGRRFFAMEYLEGQPLSALITRLRRAVPLPISLRILTRVLAGLEYAHELTNLEGEPLGVVHRDVTPQNIFLCYGGPIKLVDFGIAKAMGAAARTKTGVFKGKLAYASPEQIEGLPVSPRTDIFAAGVLLWEALAGQSLARGLEEPAILHKRLAGEEPKVLEVNPEAPAELAAICDKAMARAARDRFATAAEMAQAIQAFIDRSGMRATDEDVGALVSQTFNVERSVIRKKIQERLSEAAPKESPPPLELVASPSSSGAFLTDDVMTAVAPSSPSATAPIVAAGTERAKLRHRALLGLVAIGVLGAGAAVFYGSARRSSGASPAAIAAGAPSPAAPTPASPDVAVYVGAEPAATRFTLDDAPLDGNPFTGRLPHDDKTTHTLRASAPGFDSEQRTLTLDRDLHVELSLTAAPPKAAGSPRVPAPPRVGPRVAVPAGHRPPPIDSSDPYAGGAP